MVPLSVIRLKAEDLAYWYFRLNGFLTIRNFVVHPESGCNQRTDADILGVRFPYRSELLDNPMQDDTIFEEVKDIPFLVLAEVKSSECKLNKSWTREGSRNILRMLAAVGIVPLTIREEVARVLHTDGIFEDTCLCRINLFCLGRRINPDIEKHYCGRVPQKRWEDVLKFIHDRFRGYDRIKREHPQWDENGDKLWTCYQSNKDNKCQFISSITVIQWYGTPSLLRCILSGMFVEKVQRQHKRNQLWPLSGFHKRYEQYQSPCP